MQQDLSVLVLWGLEKSVCRGFKWAKKVGTIFTWRNHHQKTFQKTGGGHQADWAHIVPMAWQKKICQK